VAFRKVIEKDVWELHATLRTVIENVKIVLSPEARDKRLYIHDTTTEEIKENSVPSDRIVDLTYATSSSQAA